MGKNGDDLPVFTLTDNKPVFVEGDSPSQLQFVLGPAPYREILRRTAEGVLMRKVNEELVPIMELSKFHLLELVSELAELIQAMNSREPAQSCAGLTEEE